MDKRAPPASAAARQRRARHRRRHGEVVLSVVVEEHALIEALLRSGRLTDDQALRRSLVEAALGRLIAQWAYRWLHNA
jgi:hypothetical protein